jgi:hypothetical protein
MSFILQKIKAFICFLLIFQASVWSGEFRLIDSKEFRNMGMFAAALEILGQLLIYETQDPVKIEGLLVDFGTYGLYYDPEHGPNWWNYFFEPVRVGEWEKAISLNKKDYFQAFKKRKQLTRIQAAELVKKYIRVKKHFLEKVEEFVSRHFDDVYVIGVHYRGTDKRREAPRVSYEEIFQAIVDHLPKNREWRIFAATDEQPFLEEINRAFPGSIIACEAHRSINEKGIHFCRENPYAVGEEALMDALLLSRCDLLIRTSSNLSLWSTYLNPVLPTILLNNSFRSLEHAEPE